MDYLGATAELAHRCWDVAIPAGQPQMGSQGDFCGTANFVVIVYGASGRDLLVNEIGAYSGSVIVRGDAMILEIKADGNWSVDISSR